MFESEDRYLKGTLPKNSAPTIGVEFATKNVVLRNGGTVKAQIWDTGKDLKFSNLKSYSWNREIQSHLQRVSSNHYIQESGI